MNCPKCGYARKAKEAAPEWQCPACGVAYAKVLNAPPPPPRHAAPAAPAASGSGGFLKYTAITAASIAIALVLIKFDLAPSRQGTDLATRVSTSAAAKKASEIDWKQSYIVMYSLSDCGFCAEKRAIFKAQNIPFVEYFLDLDKSRLEELSYKLHAAGIPGGGIATPTFEVNGRMLPNNPPLEEILRAAST